MHVATKQHIVGMLTMIRQACHSIEAAIAADAQWDVKKSPALGADLPEEDEDSQFLSEAQERKLGEMLGFIEPEQPKEKAKKSK